MSSTVGKSTSQISVNNLQIVKRKLLQALLQASAKRESNDTIKRGGR